MSDFDDRAAILVSRLRETAKVIERMLQDDRHETYFEALRRKASGQPSVNVTAEFFAPHF